MNHSRSLENINLKFDFCCEMTKHEFIFNQNNALCKTNKIYKEN